MKKSVITIGSILILILSALVFVLLPAFVGSANPFGSLPHVGRYKHRTIRMEPGSDFQNAYAANLGSISSAEADTYRVRQDMYSAFASAFRSTVISMAEADEVKASGYRVPTSEINQGIVDKFTPQGGVFEADLYRRASKSTKQAVRKQVIQERTALRFSEDYIGTAYIDEYARLYGAGGLEHGSGDRLFGAKVSEPERDFLLAMIRDERLFELVAYDINELPDSVKDDFAEKNAGLFVRYDLSVLSYEKEQDAKKTLARINSGDISFEDAVEDSKKYYSGGDGKISTAYRYLYQLKRIIPDESDLATVQALQKDALSGVIRTASGYSIFRADGASSAADFTDAAADAALESYIKSYERGLIESHYARQAEALAASAATRSFAQAAEEAGLEVVELPPFPLNYSNVAIGTSIPDGQEYPQIQGASMSENFLRTAFGLKEGEVSSTIVLGNHVVVLHFVSRQQIDEETYGSKERILPQYILYYNQDSILRSIIASPDVQDNTAAAFSAYYPYN